MPLLLCVPDFATANPLYAGAQVTFWNVDANGARLATRATLYANATSSAALSNPVTLDSEGKFAAPVFLADPAIAEVAGPNIGSHYTGLISVFADEAAAVVAGLVADVTALKNETSGFRDEAEGFKDSAEAAAADVNGYARKDQNLSDIANPATALANLSGAPKLNPIFASGTISMSGGTKASLQGMLGAYLNPNATSVQSSVETSDGVEGGFFAYGGILNAVYFGSWSAHPVVFRAGNADAFKINADLTVQFIGYGAGFLKADASGNVSSVVVPDDAFLKAWVNFNGLTGGVATINKSFNIASVTRNTFGTYTVVFTTPMASTHYVPVFSLTGAGSTNVKAVAVIKGNPGGIDNKTVNGFSFCTGDPSNGSLVDCIEINVAVFGG